MKNEIQKERAKQCWPFLIKNATTGQFSTYGEIAEKLSIHHRSMRFVLDEIQFYCLDMNLPPLTILVINKETGKQGKGFICEESEVSQKICDVLTFNWNRIKNPF